jgi:nitrogen-specific signal transduction histidine kinase
MMNIKHILNSYPEPTILLDEDHRIVAFNNNFDVLVQDKETSINNLSISINFTENNYILIKVLKSKFAFKSRNIFQISFQHRASGCPLG